MGIVHTSPCNANAAVPIGVGVGVGVGRLLSIAGLCGFLGSAAAAASGGQLGPASVLELAQQAYAKASNTDAGDGFGFAMAISGDTLVIGAPYEDSAATAVDGDQSDNSASDAGAVYVFVRTSKGWSQQSYIKASNTEAFDGFGSAVAIDGDTLVVGAPGEDSAATGPNSNQSDNSANLAGAVYVFVRNGGNWAQQAYLKASNTDAFDEFGGAVGISGDTIVVGAQGESSPAFGVGGSQGNGANQAGAAYVFVRQGGAWTQQEYLKPQNTGAGDIFGASVAIDGDTIAVGAYREDSNATGINGNGFNNSALDAGATYVFMRNNGLWTQQAYLKASNTETFDEFGFSVAVDGDTLVVGATREASDSVNVGGSQNNNNAPFAGAAYVFVRSGTSWSQQAYLKASNTGPGDAFGWSVDVRGDQIVVGAQREDSAATGVNGNQGNDDSVDSGAAYLYSRSGSQWASSAYVKASNTDPGDNFGYAVVLSTDGVVVGAPAEDSNATGVNGNQADNQAEEAGAAYTYSQSVGDNLHADGFEG